MGRDMNGPTVRVAKEETEAASWHARLGASEVDPQTLKAFFEWRAKPGHAAAYRRVEEVWRQAESLKTSPEVQTALAAAMQRRSAREAKGPSGLALGGLAAIGAMLALGVGGWWWTEVRNVYSTAVGEQQVVQLSDGSSVRLDTDSRLRVRYTGDRRTIALEKGQALFEVAKDAGRPFVVDVDGAQVTAVGTVFDVRREVSGLRVTLVEGVVDVADRGGRERLTAGRQARVRAGRVESRPVDARAATSWTEGRIVLVDARLQDAVMEVNRYLTEPVILASDAPVSTPVNGSFRVGDRDAFVAAASGALGLKARSRADGAVVLSQGG